MRCADDVIAHLMRAANNAVWMLRNANLRFKHGWHYEERQKSQQVIAQGHINARHVFLINMV